VRCAFVIPSWKPGNAFASNTAGSHINYWVQPLGILYIASSVMKAGHEARFFHGAFRTNSDILEELKEYKPEFIGIYSTAFGWDKAVKTAADARKILKDVHITVGGPYPISVKEKCFEDSDAIDSVVTGEGEITIVEMLEKLAAGKSLQGVEGIIYKENGNIVKNPDRPLLTDLDKLPFPARELLGEFRQYVPSIAMYRRKPIAMIVTSRGCNGRCLYCSQIDTKRESGVRGVRFRSVENIIKEIKMLLKLGYKEIKFTDDTIAADYDRAMHLAKEIKAQKLDFTWFASACVNQVDEPLLRAFKKSGCWGIWLGVESGVQKNLNTLRKGITLEQIRDTVKAAKKTGIWVYNSFIFGIPGETYEEGLQTIEFALELNPGVANFYSLGHFHDTELYDNVEKYGAIVTDDLTQSTYQGTGFVPYTMTREQICELRRMAFKRFYIRPRYILKKILEFRNINDVRASMKNLIQFCLSRNNRALTGKNDTPIDEEGRSSPSERPQKLPVANCGESSKCGK